MKKLIALLPFILFLKHLEAQTTVVHDSHAEARTISSFHAIEVSNGIDLILKQGNDEAVAVSATTPEIRNRIKTEVVNGELKIYFDSKGLRSWKNNGQLKAYVSFKNLDRLEANSGADVTTDGDINVQSLSIDLSSGADFNGSVIASQLDVKQSSGSDMTIKGRVADLKITTNSGSDFDGYDLESETCMADASSGSDIEITVNKNLKASASSGGDIKYKGNASLTSINNSSGGRIKKQG
ncbi:MAG: DUF2807 domain-containing protein [Bacteroidetes bacterium]|nr:DUF2807 domain-containing protein [Bacteroidota bacterium]